MTWYWENWYDNELEEATVIIDFGEACRAYWAAIKKVREERTIFRSLEEPRDN